MAAGRLFRRISFEDACQCVRKWHFVQELTLGTDCFGVEENGKVIAAAVFVDGSKNTKIGELVATVKSPDTKLQISQLLKYCRKQLRNKYLILATFCNIHTSKGGQLKGDYWRYGGLMNGKAMEKPTSFLQAYHFYWVPLSKAGESFAKSMGLEDQPYPK